MELLALVKHDCPVCDQVLPVLDAARQRGAPIRILSQSGPEETEAQAQRLNLARVPELDRDLELSARFDPDAVPTLVLLDGGAEADRVEGLDRARVAELARRGRAPPGLDRLPPRPPGSARPTPEPLPAAPPAAPGAPEGPRPRG